MLTYRPLRKDELEAGMRLVLEQDGQPNDRVDEKIQAFRGYAAIMGLDISRQWGAFDRDAMVSTCLCIYSPGRTGMIFLPNRHQYQVRDDLREVLRYVIQDASSRDVHMLQALISPESSAEEARLRDAGFHLLAELIYMQRDAGERFADPPPTDSAAWIRYAPEHHSLFRDTVLGTYEASLDCPGLSGLRTIEDILTSHRTAGEFDPNRWVIAVRDGQPAGVLLMSRVPGRDILDVVYMGVLPAYRGHGIGRVLLHQAVRLSRDYHCDWITLAVDAGNTPALRLYQSCGFKETTRRRAWIIAPNRPNS